MGATDLSEGTQILAGRSFHVMAKPIGPLCNLDCTYCFYLEKEKLFGAHERFAMPDHVLEEFIRQTIESELGQEVRFAWQGGEPTLLGVGYFQKVVALQAKYARGKTVQNVLQTNGTLLDEAWGDFLQEHSFLVGISLDGPRELHDRYRVDKKLRPTFDRVMAGLEILKNHRVKFNTLTVVNRDNSKHPQKVYQFLKEVGSSYIQFIPLVERLDVGAGLACPPPLGRDGGGASGRVTEWSVESVDYGSFLIGIFDEWVRRDVGRIFVQTFDVALGSWMGLGSSLCIFAEKCGSAVALEHNGDLYSCDHYVYPKYQLGNLLNQSLGEMVSSPAQKAFGSQKLDSLPDYCRRCDVRFACNGECPKNRFIETPDGQPGLNYLCAGYKTFFKSIDPCMKMMARLLGARRPASDIMQLLAERDHRLGLGSVGGQDRGIDKTASGFDLTDRQEHDR